MQAPLRDKKDIKIFILFLMNKINQPMDFYDINDIVVQDGVVGALEFAECFAELLDSGNIVEYKEDGKELYAISPKGVEVAENLSSELVSYIRNKSLKSALRLISFKKNGNSIETSARERADGRFDFTCRILQKKEPLMEINMVVDTYQQLEVMNYHFNDRPEVIYRGVMALLTGEIDFLLN